MEAGLMKQLTNQNRECAMFNSQFSFVLFNTMNYKIMCLNFNKWS